MISRYLGKIKKLSLNKLYKYSIYRRLIWCFIYVFVLPILLIGGYNAVYSFSKNEREAKTFLEESSAQIANNISYYMFSHVNLLEEVATNPEIINDLMIYNHVDWNKKSDIENHIRLVLGSTFRASGAINACEMISLNNSYFYHPSPVSNGNFTTSKLLSKGARQVRMTVSPKEVPSDRNSYVILTRGIYSDKDTYTCVGNIVAALDLSYFNKVCYENVTNLLNEVMIIDENNIIISASNEDQVGSTFNGDKMLSISISKSISNTNLTIVNHIALQTLLKSALIQFAITLFTAVLFAVLAFIFAILFAKSITGPINRLMEEMKKTDVEKFVEDDGDDEYHTVIEGFNKMSRNLVEAMKRQYNIKLQETKLRELRKEAELSALQQQINPHFLYNTLESIYWNGQLEGDEEISEIVSALGNYLRVIIVKGREYVTIENEVESVNNYIFLQNKRFGNRIINSWDVSLSLRHTKIIKLAIHPIVEDVISTNLDDIESQININISIVAESDTIRVVMTGQAVEYFLSLADNFDLDIRGINSVNERLTLYYGDAFGVVLDNGSWEIRVTMPVYKDNGSEGKK
ncbi:HAMP domain-containing protein [Mobilisporobacter senegalensis]|uniref:HAMP domain-containing protein n=1 Tax=Mobilisporobacter senegalensis TaxID=1329262 RepID=A0A3N1XV05_9FIRM|nr:sensor histidine kinase [Mobilisporobacter senegalensis]ROR30450.1 HAMP domain-containing protein [Mobilisporobacter senegalensis]